MSMKLGYDLTIEQTQKLTMTPELIQAIRILQFNTQELDSYVQDQLLNNPVLEQDAAAGDSADGGENSAAEQESVSSADREEIDWKEYLKEKQYDDISYRQWEYKDPEEKENSYEQYVSSDVTLPEHLMFQLQFASLGSGSRRIGAYIIESLDENGYMTLTAEEIAKACGVSEQKVEDVLDVIHTFDPVGVGARNLSECLGIQLEYRGGMTEPIRRVLNDYLEDLAANRLAYIAKELGMPVIEIQDMADIIKGLEPKPGRQFAGGSETRYIVPDVLVERVDGEYIVTVNDSSSPKLMVSSYYEKLLSEAEKDSKLSQYLSDRFNSAVWLIRSIDQRKQTIRSVVSAVVKYQQDFFEYGPKHLKTLTLKQIADEVGIHESTVSRSINGKYMQSPRGVFEIKYFFSGGVQGDRGEGISSRSIKDMIREIIGRENPKSPCSDQQIVKMLEAKGIVISRRTVAKYRDEMNILSSSKRRRY